MTLGRRAFLRFTALSPLAAKKAADAAAAELSGTIIAGHGNWYGSGDAPSNGSSGMDEPTKTDWRRMLSNDVNRSEVESVMFEDERKVGFIEPDIAVARSYSLNAKIAYQRQRNVERRLRQLQEEWPWQKLEGIGKRIMKAF